MDFKPYQITLEEYQERSLLATQEQVKLLKASKEFGRWEKRRSRLRFWSAWVPQISSAEIFLMIATVGLMIGVCYSRNALQVRL